MQVPSNLIPTRITQLPDSPVASEDGLLLYIYGGNTYKIRAGDLLSVSGVPPSRQVLAGTSLQGGGALSADVTLSVAPGGIGTAQLASTGVTPGQYGAAASVPVVTIDATGRVTSITTVAVDSSGGVPATRQVIAGTGLTGGGALSSDVTLNVALSNATPLDLLNTGAAGISTSIARADHQHPAVDLADDTQVNGLLGLDSGGTARSIVAAAGALLWSGADGLYVGPVGQPGQVPVSGGTGEYTWGNVLVMTDQPANVVYAGPVSGPDGATSFRALVNADLPVSGVSAGSYGSATQVAQVTLSSKGVATAATNVTVTPAFSSITSTPTTLAGYGINDAQPLDATLTALAGTTNNANQLPYFTGVDLMATTGLTAFARTVLDDADAATARSTLGASSVLIAGTNIVLSDSGSAITVSTSASPTFTSGISGGAF